MLWGQERTAVFVVIGEEDVTVGQTNMRACVQELFHFPRTNVGSRYYDGSQIHHLGLLCTLSLNPIPDAIVRKTSLQFIARPH